MFKFMIKDWVELRLQKEREYFPAAFTRNSELIHTISCPFGLNPQYCISLVPGGRSVTFAFLLSPIGRDLGDFY